MDKINYNVTTVIWIVAGAVLYIYLILKYWGKLNFLLFITVIDFFVAFNEMITGNLGVLYCSLGLLCGQSFGILLYVRKKKTDSVLRLSQLFCLLILVFTLQKYMTHQEMRLSKLVNFNSISIMLIMFNSIYIIHCVRNKKKVGYLLPIIALITSIMASRTGGILACSFLVLGLYFIKNNKINKKSVVVAVILGIIIIAKTTLSSDLVEVLSDDNSRFWI